MATKRKDKDGRLLKKGERELSNDYGYEYRWTDRFGKRQSIYARDLDELRRQEADIELKNSLLPSNRDDLTLNQLYELWKSVKRGLKPNTFNNYKYMYEKYVQRAKSHSAFDLGVDVDTENKKTIVTLSTCSGKTGGTQRFLIHGVWIDEKVTED